MKIKLIENLNQGILNSYNIILKLKEKVQMILLEFKNKNCKKSHSIKQLFYIIFLLIILVNSLFFYYQYLLLYFPELAEVLVLLYFLLNALSAYIFVFYFTKYFIYYRLILLALIVSIKFLGLGFIVMGSEGLEQEIFHPELLEDKAYFFLGYNYLVLMFSNLDYGALLLVVVPLLNSLILSLELFYFNGLELGNFEVVFMKGGQPSQLLKLLEGQPHRLPSPEGVLVPQPKTIEDWSQLQKISFVPLIKGGVIEESEKLLPFKGKLVKFGEYLADLVCRNKPLMQYLQPENLQRPALVHQDFVKAFGRDCSNINSSAMSLMFQGMYPDLHKERSQEVCRSLYLLHYSRLCQQINVLGLSLEEKCSVLECDKPLSEQIANVKKSSDPNVAALQTTIKDNLLGVDCSIKDLSLDVKEFHVSKGDAFIETTDGKFYALEVKRTYNTASLDQYLREKFLSEGSLKFPLYGVVLIDSNLEEEKEIKEILNSFNKSFFSLKGPRVSVRLYNEMKQFPKI